MGSSPAIVDSVAAVWIQNTAKDAVRDVVHRQLNITAEGIRHPRKSTACKRNTEC
jgi:hypothetical protein